MEYRKLAPLSRRLLGSIVFALVVTSCLAPNAVAEPQKVAANSVRTVVLKFPKKKGFGRLKINNSKEIEARGDITVPVGVPITFSVGWDALHDLSPLRKLPPGVLTCINFRGLEIGDHQMQNLEHLNGLLNINLRDTDVTDKGMESISKIHSLAIVNLQGTLCTDACFAILSKLENLKDITLSLTNTGDAGLKSIPAMKSLMLVNLTHTQITDKGLKWVGMSPTLTNVELSMNKFVTDAGMEYFKNSKTLTELGLANTSVTADGIKKLKNVKSLRTIIYSRNNITNAQVHSIRKLMPKVEMGEILQLRHQKQDLFEPHHMFAPLH